MKVYIVYELRHGWQPRMEGAFKTEEAARERVKKEREMAEVFGLDLEYYYQETELII